MSFFDDDFYKELDKDIEVSTKKENDSFKNDSFKSEEDCSYYPDNLNLEVNKRNSETFKDLMDNASVKKDDYWDFNNPAVKIFLLILFIIIVCGLLYYLIGWFTLA